MRLKCLLLGFGTLLAAPLTWSCDQLVMSANTDYFPYSWRLDDGSLRMEGAMIRLVEQVGKEAGITITSLYTGPWARTQKDAYSGKVDLIAGAFYTQQRAQLVDYLHPALTVTESVIWVNKGAAFDFKQLSDLQNKEGATIINNSLGQAFDEYAQQHLNLYMLANIEHGFRMLNSRRVDYVVYEKEPSLAFIEQLNLKNIIHLETPISTEPLYLVFSKASKCNTPEVRDRLNTALEKAQKQQWAQRHLSDMHSFQPPSATSVRD